jgi:SPP1 gp7 family putative phage head morphogenesis protein
MAKVSDLKIRGDDYWEKRFENQTKRMYNLGDKAIPEINKLYGRTASGINDRVNAFYAKYGTIQNSPTFKTLADGSQVVSGSSSKLVVPKSVANKTIKGGTRLTKLQKDVKTDLVTMSKAQNNIMKSNLGGVATDAYYDTLYELYRGYGVGTSFNLLSPTVVNQLIMNPVNGQNFSTRVWNNRDALANQVNQILTDGIIKGVSNKEMTKQLSQRMDSGRKVANRLIRTEVTNTYAQSSLQGYNDSGIVKQYEYLATLDNRTSEICTELDGKIFDTDKAITGLNYPPMHPNCRSTTVAHFDNSKEGLTRIARGLGGNTFTVPATMNVKDFKAIYVEGSMTRKEWERKR